MVHVGVWGGPFWRGVGVLFQYRGLFGTDGGGVVQFGGFLGHFVFFWYK